MFTRKRLTQIALLLAPVACVAALLAWYLLPGDPPAAPEQGSLAPVEAVLKFHPCPPSTVRAAVADLSTELRDVPNVRITPHEQLGQIAVIAPPDIQAFVARRLTSPSQDIRLVAYQSPAPSPASPSPASRSHSVQLRHVTGQQIESALIDALGGRLTPLSDETQLVRDYRLSLPNGGQISLSIDYQANRATLLGPPTAVDSSVRMIESLDVPRQSRNRAVEAMSVSGASPTAVRQVVDAIRSGTAGPYTRLASAAFQPEGFEEPYPGEYADGQYPLEGEEPYYNGEAGEFLPAEAPPETGLIGPVNIEMIPGLDVLIIQGNRRDVERVMEVIEEVERLSAETEPVIVVHGLQHVQCEALADLILPLYEEIYEPRQGTVSITALVKPNSLLLIGRRDNIQTVLELASQLDRPVSPEAEFRVFRLRYASATDAQATITEFFGQEGISLSTRVIVTTEYRSNSLIVQAGPRDMLEVARLIEQIDTPEARTVNVLRMFNLYHSYAEEVEFTLEDAIAGEPLGAESERSGALSFVTVDGDGQQRLNSGILSGVRVTSDPQANTLWVSAPAESMDLIAAVVGQLDRPPVAETQVKVFTILHGDAYFLRIMLEDLFLAITENETATQTGALEGESSLVRLSFVEDVRTNSIVAAGSAGDLMVVDAILSRLDESEIRKRTTVVYRLRNAPATDVAEAVNEYLDADREVMQVSEEMLSPYDQIQREVVVVPEVISNSLIISATPRFFDEIMEVVLELDAQPPMVMIQVLIAEVGLSDADEFGVEFGLQDALFFDRSQLTNLSTLTTTTSTQEPGGATVTTESQEIISADVTPGFAFANPTVALPNSGVVLEAARILATQGISHFGVGRLNSELGYGGFVFSASSDVLSILLRALKEERRLEVLSRPQIMTLDSQPAQILVGQLVPLISGVTVADEGQTYSTSQQEVGLILEVTARINPDDMVVMELTAEKSSVGPEEEGVPVSISASGEVIRTPRIDTVLTETTILAADAQTVVIGGLITKSKSFVTRKVPLAGDVPVLGRLFRYDSAQERRSELLIILTPRVVRSECQAELLKQEEAARMSWCLCDVLEFVDDPGLRCRYDEWPDSETHVIYPDMGIDGQILPMPEEPGGNQPGLAPLGDTLPESTVPGNGSLSPQSDSVPSLNPSSRQASTETSPLAAAWPPAGTQPQTVPTTQHAAYLPQAYPATAQQAAYQPSANPTAQIYAAPNSTTIEFGYDTRPAEYQQPVGAESQQNQLPAAQSTQYWQPYQPSTAPPAPQHIQAPR